MTTSNFAVDLRALCRDIVRETIMRTLRYGAIHRYKRKHLMRFVGDRVQTRKDMRMDRHGKR